MITAGIGGDGGGGKIPLILRPIRDELALSLFSSHSLESPLLLVGDGGRGDPSVCNT